MTSAQKYCETKRLLQLNKQITQGSTGTGICKVDLSTLGICTCVQHRRTLYCYGYPKDRLMAGGTLLSLSRPATVADIC